MTFIRNESETEKLYNKALYNCIKSFTDLCLKLKDF